MNQLLCVPVNGYTLCLKNVPTIFCCVSVKFKYELISIKNLYVLE